VIRREGALTFDNVWDNVHPQGGSQWDALGHVGYTADEYYNGATAAQVESGERNSIGAWGDRGIAGRGVLLDIPAPSLRPDWERLQIPAHLEIVDRCRSKAALGTTMYSRPARAPS
jgi:hypothetical protein